MADGRNCRSGVGELKGKVQAACSLQLGGLIRVFCGEENREEGSNTVLEVGYYRQADM